jgi:hypothetical protein
MSNITIKIGPTANDFKVIDGTGADITDKLSVKAVRFCARAGEAMAVQLEMYANVELTIDEGTLRVRPSGPPNPENFEQRVFLETEPDDHGWRLLSTEVWD